MERISRRRRDISFVLGLIIGFATPMLFAQDKPTPVVLHAGESVSLKGKVQGYAGAAYSVRAEVGQQLHVSLQASKGVALFNVYAPGGGQEALFRGEVSGNAADLNLGQAGEYRVDVYQMRSSARRGTATTFSLTLALKN